MEILLKLWSIFAVVGWLLLVWIGVCFYVCRKYTGTWNGLRYMFDYKYWSFAVLNHNFAEAKDKGISVQDFILDFNKRILLPKQKGIITRMRESERQLLVMLLSQEDFLTDNFGTKPYTAALHKEICRNWDEHLKCRPYGEE